MKNKIFLFISIFLFLWLIGMSVAFYFLWTNQKKDFDTKLKAKDDEIASLQDELNAKSEPQTSEGEESPSPEQEECVAKTYQLYFSKTPNSDDDPSAVFAVSRKTCRTDVATFLVEEYLKGPSSTEKTQGYVGAPEGFLSGTSNCSGKDFTLKVSDSRATLKFCKDTTLSGVLSDARINSALTENLDQFSTVDQVVILTKNGDCLFDESGMNLCLQD